MITINPKKLVRNVTTNGDFIFRGGLALQAELGVQNVKRFAKFLTTTKGQLFVTKQFLLQSLNADPNTRNYNPLAPFVSKALPQELTHLKPKIYRKPSFGDGIGGAVGKLFDKLSPERKSTQKGTEPAITYFSNVETDASIQVRYGGKPGDLQNFPNRKITYGNTEPIEDLIKFRIRDAVNGKYIIFPAFLGGITDNSTATYTDYSYIGRPDKVYVYSGYTRSINFNIDVVATREEEIPIIWEKINYAKGLTLPQYKSFFSKSKADGGGQEDSTRPVAPLVYLTLGDLFNDTPGFFESVNMSIPESSTWELEDGHQVPHICQLSFNFTYVGKYNPTMTSAHFGNVSKKQGKYRTLPDEKYPGFKMGDPSEKDAVTEFNKKLSSEASIGHGSGEI